MAVGVLFQHLIHTKHKLIISLEKVLPLETTKDLVLLSNQRMNHEGAANELCKAGRGIQGTTSCCIGGSP